MMCVCVRGVCVCGVCVCGVCVCVCVCIIIKKEKEHYRHKPHLLLCAIVWFCFGGSSCICTVHTPHTRFELPQAVLQSERLVEATESRHKGVVHSHWSFASGWGCTELSLPGETSSWMKYENDMCLSSCKGAQHMPSCTAQSYKLHSFKLCRADTCDSMPSWSTDSQQRQLEMRQLGKPGLANPTWML